MATGHNTDIYPYRYVAARTRSDFREETDRPMDLNYYREQEELGDASATFYITAPCDGKLVRLEVNSLTTTDGTNRIQLVGTNESNSDAAMFTQLWDDSPIATAETATAGTLSTTAANLLVDQGDLIKVVYTETGTIAGGVFSLYFENF